MRERERTLEKRSEQRKGKGQSGFESGILARKRAGELADYCALAWPLTQQAGGFCLARWGEHESAIESLSPWARVVPCDGLSCAQCWAACRAISMIVYDCDSSIPKCPRLCLVQLDLIAGSSPLLLPFVNCVTHRRMYLSAVCSNVCGSCLSTISRLPSAIERQFAICRPPLELVSSWTLFWFLTPKLSLPDQ